MATKLAHANQDCKGELFCIEVLYLDAVAFATSRDPDTMYLHQAMKEPEKDKFIAAMVEEMNTQLKGKNVSLILRSKVPKGTTTLPAVWQMKHKCQIKPQEVYKWKACLNIDGSCQVKGCDCWDTYALLVEMWGSVQLILAKVIIQGWHSKQINFVMAYTQLKGTCTWKFLKALRLREMGITFSRHLWPKASTHVWIKHLVDNLKSIRFCQCQAKECVFTRGKAIYILYIDDSILTGPDLQELDKIIEDMKRVGLDLTVKGDILDFLSVNIQHHKDSTVHLTQPHLINSILEELRLQADSAKVKSMPAASSKLLCHHDDAPPHDKGFHYRHIIGKLNYLEKST